MFENIMNFFKKFNKKENSNVTNSKDAAKERLHLVLMQDRANVSVDFLELMKQEIIDVIKKYIEVDENAIDVRLTNKENGDGTNGAPALYANIPILNMKNEVRKVEVKAEEKKEEPKIEVKEEKKEPVKKESQIEEETEVKNIQENVDIIIDDSSVEEKVEVEEEKKEPEEITENTSEVQEEKKEIKSKN